MPNLKMCVELYLHTSKCFHGAQRDYFILIYTVPRIKLQSYSARYRHYVAKIRLFRKTNYLIG